MLHNINYTHITCTIFITIVFLLTSAPPENEYNIHETSSIHKSFIYSSLLILNIFYITLLAKITSDMYNFLYQNISKIKSKII